MTRSPTSVDYVLGHTPRELDRLDLQGFLYRGATLRTFQAAGIGAGMRVLDLGCGSGDVALLAGELVGPDGHVTGVDREAGTVESARERARARGADHVEFRVGEVGDRLPDGPYDALVGRFILMHLPDPADALRRAVRNVRPGGPVAFVESCGCLLAEGPNAFPHAPLHDRVTRWKCDVVSGAGGDLWAGFRHRHTFTGAGLPAPETLLEVPVGNGPDSPVHAYMAESVRSMLPMARQLGIPGFDEDSVQTLEAELRAEAARLDGTVLCWPVVGAWSRAAAVEGGSAP